MRSVAKWSLLSAATLAIVAFAWFSSAFKQPLQTPFSAPTSAAQEETPAPAPVPAPARVDPPQTRSAAANEYKAAFQSATDYKALAEALLPAAKAGNADAQYYLARVLEYCAEAERMYFRRRGQKLSLNEGLQFAVKRRLPIDVAQRVFDRCNGFDGAGGEDLGAAADWLSKATDAGQPLAEASTATKLLLRQKMENFSRAGAVAVSGPQITAGKLMDPTELLKSALKSKDPEVLFAIGEAQSLLSPSENDMNAVRYAWWLVACERGLDCSGSAEWVRNACAESPECASASNPSDLVRTLSGDDWPQVQQRAQEINSKLDTGQWDELRLDAG